MKMQAWFFVASALAAAACNSSGGGLTSPGAVVSGSEGAASSGQALGIEGTWRLVELAATGMPAVSVTEPDRFTATFGTDGRVDLRADCNRCTAGYSVQADSLRITPMACTLAACASAPLDTDFAGLVTVVTTWRATENSLELKSAAGTARFKR